MRSIKTIKIWNKAFPTEDGSKLTSIKKHLNILKISSGSSLKWAEVHIEKIPQDWNERFKEFRLAPRVKKFVQENSQEFDNHSFPDLVMTFLRFFGESGVFKSEKDGKEYPTLKLRGKIVHRDTGEIVAGTFEIGYIDRGAYKLVCHRLFRPTRFNSRVLHVSKRQENALPFWLKHKLQRRGTIAVCFVVGDQAHRWRDYCAIDGIDTFFYKAQTRLIVVGTCDQLQSLREKAIELKIDLCEDPNFLDQH